MWCPRVVQQELMGNHFPIDYPEGMLGSGCWFWCPRVAQQELMENRLPINYPDDMLGSCLLYTSDAADE